MKTIENKVASISKDKDTLATYGDLIVSLLNRPLSKSADLKTMRRDLRLLDLFDTEESAFEVNKEDFDYIANLVETSEWAIRHKDIIAFADYFESLKD